MSTIELFGFDGSTYLRTVQMVCEHKNLAYVVKPLAFRTGSHRALHPFLKMPVLKHRDITIFESLAICEYLEDIAPSVKLIPSETLTKALAYQWISAYIDYIAPILIHGKPDNDNTLWPEQTDEYLTILDKHLHNHTFLTGDSPCLADLYLSPALEYALKGSGFATLLQRHQHLSAWWDKASACTIFTKTQAA